MLGVGREDMFKIADYKQFIENICKDLQVKCLDLVRSATREDFQPERSDIDVLVEFNGLHRLFYRYFELKIRLEQLLGRNVDIIQYSAVNNPYVKRGLNRNKVRIYGS